jgi:leucyl-tRNA synthetase
LLFKTIYNAWYDKEADRARTIGELVNELESGVRATGGKHWEDMTPSEREGVLSEYRLAYLADTEVNWCPSLGTVLADSEVTDAGLSERGNHPVYRKRMVQWTMRITAYSKRLSDDLETLNWPEGVKATQRNWINGAGGEGEPMYDWSFGRQRYWGEPFPIVYGEDGTPHVLPDDMLPVTLPEMASFAPTPGDENSEPAPPLARASEWVNVQLDLGDGLKSYRREVNTMPQWAGSCWYYLRYLAPKSAERFTDRAMESKWLGVSESKPQGGVDLYVGGSEHSTGHLLYSRFWHKVLYDLGEVSSPEPFGRLFNQGYVQAWAYTDERGVHVPAEEVVEQAGSFFYKGMEVTRSYGKMGKSLKNSVTPEEVCEEFGADALRWALLSSTPLEVSRPWNPDGPKAARRQLERLWRVVVDPSTGIVREWGAGSDEVKEAVDTVAFEVSEAYEQLSFNVALARITELVNLFTRDPGMVSQNDVETLLRLAAPVVPHISEELWRELGHEQTILRGSWPKGERKVVDMVVYPVQINGKVRAKVTLPQSYTPEQVEKAVMEDPQVSGSITLPVRRVTVVPGRIVSIVP